MENRKIFVASDYDDIVAIEELDFSIRTYNCLKRHGINTLGELKHLSEDELIHVRNLGKKSYEEILNKVDMGKKMAPLVWFPSKYGLK